MKFILIIVTCVFCMFPLCAEEASDVLASLQKKLEAVQQELQEVQKLQEVKKSSDFNAKLADWKKRVLTVETEVNAYKQKLADNKKTEALNKKIEGGKAQKSENEKKPQADSTGNQAPVKEGKIAGVKPQNETKEAKPASVKNPSVPTQNASRDLKLDYALIPNAEMVLYYDKAFQKAEFNRSMRETMASQLQKEFSNSKNESIRRYLDSFKDFNFLFSINATNAIERDGSKINYDQIEWMMGWESERPTELWSKDSNVAMGTALELTQLVHQGLMAELLSQNLKNKLRFWDFKSSLSRDNYLPGWTLFFIHCYPTVTTRYTLLWAVADSRNLFFLGSASTVLNQLKSYSRERNALLPLYRQLRGQTDGKPCLATTLLFRDGAVKKIDNLLLDFRRPGDMALMQYLRRTEYCHLLLTATNEMKAHMEVTFRDSIVSKDFHNLVKQMTVPVILALFVKAEICNLSCVKEAVVDSRENSTVTLDTRMSLDEFRKLLSSQEAVKFQAGP